MAAAHPRFLHKRIANSFHSRRPLAVCSHLLGDWGGLIQPAPSTKRLVRAPRIIARAGQCESLQGVVHGFIARVRHDHARGGKKGGRLGEDWRWLGRNNMV